MDISVMCTNCTTELKIGDNGKNTVVEFDRNKMGSVCLVLPDSDYGNVSKTIEGQIVGYINDGAVDNLGYLVLDSENKFNTLLEEIAERKTNNTITEDALVLCDVHLLSPKTISELLSISQGTGLYYLLFAKDGVVKNNKFDRIDLKELNSLFKVQAFINTSNIENVKYNTDYIVNMRVSS